MYKVTTFFKKRAGMSRTDFIDYYENRHAPFILSLAPAPLFYRRSFPVPEDSTEGGFDFDVMTEVGFPDRESFHAWNNYLDSLPEVREDELNFFDPESPVGMYAMEEHSSVGHAEA